MSTPPESYNPTVTGLDAITFPVTVPSGKGVGEAPGVGVKVGATVGDPSGVDVKVGAGEPSGVEVKVGAGDPSGVDVKVGAGDPSGVDVKVGAGDPSGVDVNVGAGEPSGVEVKVGAGEPSGVDVKVGAGEPSGVDVRVGTGDPSGVGVNGGNGVGVSVGVVPVTVTLVPVEESDVRVLSPLETRALHSTALCPACKPVTLKINAVPPAVALLPLLPAIATMKVPFCGPLIATAASAPKSPLTTILLTSSRVAS